MRITHLLATLALLGIALAGGFTADKPASAAGTASMPRYQHIFLVVEENHGYEQIIGNPAAPTINRLAQTYGLATRYYSVADPSAPNYVALLGGSFFGIADDNPYYTHTVDHPSIADQLEAAGLTWHGYFQGLPYAGYSGICFPTKCGGTPDLDTLYASKHNGFPYFRHIQGNPVELRNFVPIGQLDHDLQSSQIPNFSLIVPDECHDMHGSPPHCVDSGNSGSTTDGVLVSMGDSYVGAIVNKITDSPGWSDGNNAVVVTWDEGNGTAGCCDANPGTGRVATIVITSHGPRGIHDDTPYNHYSLLQTIQLAFGVGCLQFTCDTKNVTPMIPLFAAR